jgi:putative flippase GtrA
MQTTKVRVRRLLAEAWALVPAGLFKFLGVGVIGLATNLGLLWLLERAGLALWAALAVSLAVATLVTWVLNRANTFAASGRPLHHEALRYFGVALLAQSVGYVTTLGVADILPHMPHTVAAFVGAVVATLFSYTGQRFFTFAPADADAEAATPLAPAPTPGE